jgi:hypothetical protein
MIRKKYFLKRFIKDEKAAAAAETALTILIFLMLVLGIIQMALMFNAKLMLNYAAYNAARAGIVHNGDLSEMRKAVAVSLAPLFTNKGGTSSLVIGYVKALAATSIGLGGLRLINVEIVSPGANRFRSDYSGHFFPIYDTKFTNANDLRENLLVVRVTWWYKLEIPFVSQFFSFFSPFGISHPLFRRAKIVSMCRMRMQSDAAIR